jgi:signal transduction histidine kinase
MVHVSRYAILMRRAGMDARRLLRAPAAAPVAATVLGVLAAAEVIMRLEGSIDPMGELLLALCVTAPLALVRVDVVTAAATGAAAMLLSVVTFGRATVAGVLALLVVLHLLALRRRARWSVLLVTPLLGYPIVAPVAGGTARTSAVVIAALAVLAAGLGRARRTGAEAAQRRASTQTVADAVLEHAARGERARIARELHDVVAHHISMISVQAETARLATPGMPAAGAERLSAIGDTARAALTEMRRLLGVLREDAPAATDRTPQPGLDQLNELVDEARDFTGASARLIVRGPVIPLDPGVELTAYRIVQEALSNARRHAPGAAVDVELDYAGDALRLRIRDNGPAPDGDGAVNGVGGRRHGLLGMRERAAMVEGELWTGPAPSSGFVVEAVLPVMWANAAGGGE